MMFLKAQYPVYIPGQKSVTCEYRPIHSPFDGKKIAEVGYFDQSQIEQILEIAESTFKDRKHWLPAFRRSEILKKAAGKISENAQDLALLIATEGGKPLKDALVEVKRAENSLILAAEEATRIHGEEIPMQGSGAALNRLAFTTREPIGVVVAVSAFNHPLNLIAHQVGPAVAAGCPVIVKPALETPLSCLKLIEYLYESGLPEEWAMVVNCENAVAEKLVTSPRISFFSFIGSAKVGWALRSKLAPGVRSALEHGGSAPVIVDASADLDEAVPLIVKGGYYHSGQVCVSVQRVFVQKSIHEKFVDKFRSAISRLKVGDPAEPDTDLGPLIRKREITRVHEWVQEAVQGQASLVAGGRAIGETCYEPTLLDQAPLDSKVMTEEVFGPVVMVRSFDDLDEAIGLSNQSKWSFQSAIFTKDIARALHAAKSLNASTVTINDHTAFRVDWMPFGGRGPSGLSVGGIPYTVRDLSPEKLIVIR